MIQDKTAIMQVLANIIKEPTLLSETDKYQLEKGDFPERFHKLIFAAVYNLYQSGTESISELEIDGFLQKYDIQYEIFNQNDGIEYIRAISEMAKEENFDYYYERLKKFSLIREMDGLGFDVSEVYDESIMNPRIAEELQKKFDGMSIEDILRIYETKVAEIKDKFESKEDAKGIHASDGIDNLLTRLKETPQVGLPLNSEMLTSVSRGARKQRLYIRSMPSGYGKSRNSLADCCRLSAKGWYDSENDRWVENEFDVGSVFISTEMTFEELQTPILAYIADVEEDKILLSKLTEEEEKRIMYAANILKHSKIYFEYLPDFSVEDVERVIEKNIIKHDIEYVFHDYLHSSISVLSSFAKTGGINLREDQVLLLMADKLKQIANKHQVFLMTSTQLNDGWKEAWKKGEEIDQSFIQASKSVINKADFACIMLPLSKKEKDETKEIFRHKFDRQPNYVTHIFKNRGNKYTSMKIFSYINMGTMRIEDKFCTTQENELLPVEKLEIHNSELQEVDYNEA